MYGEISCCLSDSDSTTKYLLFDLESNFCMHMYTCTYMYVYYKTNKLWISLGQLSHKNHFKQIVSPGREEGGETC